MNSKHISTRAHFNDLLIGMEREHGTRDTCVHFLECLKEALRYTDFCSTDDLKKQFTDFYELFTHMKPRMAIIQNYMDDILEHMLENPSDDPTALVQTMVLEIEQADEDNAKRNIQLVKEACKLVSKGDRILIHNHSHTVLDVLDKSFDAKKKFEVIVAEQDATRTLDCIKYLKDHDIPFVVVPEFMLSFLEQDISCMLIGAVTLKHDMHFVVNAGTKAVVSEMNAAKIPVYLMLSTNKFSYWETKKAHQTQKTIKNIPHPDGTFTYERIKFSHDRLPMDQITKIVTEEGIFTPEELKKVYKTKLAEYLALHEDLARQGAEASQESVD